MSQSTTDSKYLGRSAWVKGRGRGTVVEDHGDGHVTWMPNTAMQRSDAVRLHVSRLTFTRGR